MNVLTFDLEEWFHLLELPELADHTRWPKFESRVEGATRNLLELLNASDVTATFFCLGWVAERYPNLIRDIVDAGHQLGCHSYLHTLVHSQTREQFFDETKKAKSIIEEVSGQRVLAYRAPGFSLTESTVWAFDALIELGFTTDCSLFAGNRAHGGWRGREVAGPFLIENSRGVLLELPLLPATFFGRTLPFSGGGYFRLLPYLVINSLMARNKYNMTYFHPRDFDIDQPRIGFLGSFRGFKAYVGIERATAKLQRLLRDFDFVSVDDFAKKSLNSLQVIQLSELYEHAG